MRTKTRINQSSRGEEHIRIKKDARIVSIGVGSSYTISFDKAELGDLNDKGIILRLRGEPELPSGYRNVAKYSMLYRRYSDSFDGSELTAVGSGEGVRRALYYKVYGKETEGSTTFRLEQEYRLNGSADKAEILLEVYYKGSSKIIGQDAPDQIVSLEIPPSGGDYTVITHNFRVREAIDFFFIKVAHTGLNGEFSMKSPRIFNSMQKNIVHPLIATPKGLKPSRYIAENYSKTEKIPFRIYLNNNLVFSGDSHDRAISFPSHEWMLTASELHGGTNSITIENPRIFSGQCKFLLRDISIIKSNNRGIVYAPERVFQGKISLVIKASALGQSVVHTSSIAEIMPLQCNEIVKGLNVIDYVVIKPFVGDAELRVEIGGKMFLHRIIRYIEKIDDVRLSSGDSVFISRNKEDLGRYMEWFLLNNVGNELLMRSQYAKTGVIDAKNDYFMDVVKIAESIGMPYYNITEGEELENLTSLPIDRLHNTHFGGFSLMQMDSKYLDRDKQDLTPEQAFYHEIIAKRASSLGINYKVKLTRQKDKFVLNDNQDIKNYDAMVAEGKYLDYLGEIAKVCSLHIGKTIHFKYLFRAGIKEAGAMLEGNSQEAIIAALRGALTLTECKKLRIYISTKDIVHAETSQQYRRYLTTLYMGYIKGADSITAESGIYCVESMKSDAERESHCCSAMLKANQQFYHFIDTHNRRGRHKSNIALLSGKYDGATLTDSNTGFGQGNKASNYGVPERSWDMVRQIFYVGSAKENAWRNSLLKMNINQGFFSLTPYGEVDILPVEADVSAYIRYPYIVMSGWNTADRQFVAKITEYVANGGNLVLSCPHLYTTTLREQGVNHISNILFDSDVQKLVGAKEIKRNGDIKLTTAQPIGLEFGGNNNDVLVNTFGRGKVYFAAAFRYPCEMNFTYKQLIKHVAAESLAQQEYWGALRTNDWVSSSVYDAADRRVIYMLDIKWWKKTKADEKAMISFGRQEYVISVKRDIINICSIFHDVAILTRDSSTDIISMNGRKLTLQGNGKTEITILYQGRMLDVAVDLKGISIMNIEPYLEDIKRENVDAMLK